MSNTSRTLSLVVSDPLLTAREVAALLGVKPKRVYELPIPFVQLSARSKRWRRSDVEQFVNSRRQEAA